MTEVAGGKGKQLAKANKKESNFSQPASDPVEALEIQSDKKTAWQISYVLKCLLVICHLSTASIITCYLGLPRIQ